MIIRPCARRRADAAADEPGRPVPGGGVRPDLRARGRPRRLRPGTAPGGRARHQADICRLVAERIHLLPPFRWRLVGVPLGLDHPYWIEDPDFDLDFHIRDSAVPPPGDDRQLAETVARIFARPLDRTRPLWELYLIHGLRGRPRRAAHQGPPLRRGRRLGQRDPRRPARPEPRGPRDPAAPSPVHGGARAERARDARARADGPAAAAAARAALGADRAAQPDRAAGRERVPRRAQLSRGVTAVRRAARDRAPRPGDPRGDHGAPAADVVQRPHLRPPALLVRAALARHGQGDQERGRRDGQRRRRRALRRRAARLAQGARRAAARAARGDGAGVRAHRGADGHVRQPRLDDDRADPDQRGRPEAPAQAHARAAARRQGPPPGDARRTCSPTPRASSRPPSPRWRRGRRWRSWAARARR